MTAGIRISVTDDTIAAVLDRIDRLAAKPAPIMSAIAAYLVTATQRHIERQRGPEGKWRPLSPRTASKRIGSRRRGTANMLRVTNRLYSSLTGEATEDEASVGTNMIYAAIQHFGGKVAIPARQQTIHLGRSNRGRRFVKASSKRGVAKTVTIGAHTVTIPGRPYLYLDDQDVEAIEDIAADGFRKEAGQ